MQLSIPLILVYCSSNARLAAHSPWASLAAVATFKFVLFVNLAFEVALHLTLPVNVEVE